MTDQELKDLVASLAISQKETDEQMKETNEQMKETNKQMKETDRKLRRLEQLVGGIANNQGSVAEEYFVNSLKDTLKIGELNFDAILTNVRLKTKKTNDEFDILLVNGSSVAIIEVKYKVHPKDLEKLPKKIENLKKLPQYKQYKIYAGLAGFYIPDELIEEAKEKGYFILQRKGDLIETITTNLKAA